MPDVEKSKALKKVAEITLERLNKTRMEEYPGNTLIDFYDIIHNLMEAITLKEGVKFRMLKKAEEIKKELER